MSQLPVKVGASRTALPRAPVPIISAGDLAVSNATRQQVLATAFQNVLNPFKARIYLSANQNINDNVTTLIALNAVSFNTNGNMFSAALNAIMAPVTGYYAATANITVANPAVANTYQLARLFMSTNTTFGGGNSAIITQNAATFAQQNTFVASDIFFMNKGDYIQVSFVGITNPGGAYTWVATGGADHNYLNVHLIST